MLLYLKGLVIEELVNFDRHMEVKNLALEKLVLLLCGICGKRQWSCSRDLLRAWGLRTSW